MPDKEKIPSPTIKKVKPNHCQKLKSIEKQLSIIQFMMQDEDNRESGDYGG